MADRVLQTIVEIAGNISPTLQKAVSKACDQLDNVNVKAAAVAAACVAGAVQIGKAVVEATKYIVELGDEYDSAMRSVSATTGATGEELESLGEVVKNVYADNFGESMEEAADSVAEVSRLLGLEGDALAEAAEAAITLSDAFEYDISESTRAASALMKNFGIDAEQAYNLIAYGAQNGADQNGDLLDVLNEYSAQYSALGLSAEQFVQSLITAGDEGVFSIDKVGDAVKEFNIRSKDLSTTSRQAYQLLGLNADEMFNRFAAGGETAEEAFFEVINALEDMDDPLTQNYAAVSLFGTMYEDLGSSLLPIMSSLEQATLDNVYALEQINSVQFDDLGKMWEGVVRQFEVSILPLASTFLDVAKDIMPVLGDLLEQLSPVISEMTGALIPVIQSFAQELMPVLTALMQPISGIAQSLTTKILPPLVTIITSVLPVIVKLVDAIAMVLDPIISVLSSVLPIIAQLLSAIADMLGKSLSRVLTILSSVLEPITDTLTTLIDAVLPVVISLLDTLMPILDMIFAVLDPILDVVLSIIKPLLNLINAIIKPLTTLLQRLTNSALKPLQDAIGTVSQLFTGVFASAMEVVTPIVQTVTSALSGLLDFITNIFSGNWSAAWTSISGIFQNVWNGVVAFFKGIINGLIGMVEAGLNAIINLINNITGGLSNAWTWLGIPEIPKIPNVELPRLAKGGFTEGVSIAGEDGVEAVISFDPAYHDANVALWQQAGKLLGVLDAVELSDETRADVASAIGALQINAEVGTDSTLAKAAELITMDGFSLGGLTETTVVYYDFSNFKYAPQLQLPENSSADRQTFMNWLREHSSEFLDWLSEWVSLREAGRYDGIEVY